jgi:hypothetical protein
MLKKLVVGAIAAGVLAVPLAGVAGADPDLATNPGISDNPGTPGNFGRPAGQRVKELARLPKIGEPPDARPPGTSVDDIAPFEGFTSVGDAVKRFAPGHCGRPCVPQLPGQ